MKKYNLIIILLFLGFELTLSSCSANDRSKINQYIEISRNLAKFIEESNTPFLTYGLPIITILGGGASLWLGLLGIVKKKSYILIRWGTNPNVKVEDAEAIVSGLIYLGTFLMTLIFLLPLSLCLLGIL